MEGREGWHLQDLCVDRFLPWIGNYLLTGYWKKFLADRNGLGRIRLMRSRGMELEEVVVDWNPMKGYDYRLISRGGPVSDHYGRVRLNDRADGTEVSWTVRFRPARWGTGRILRTYLSRVFKRGLKNLKHNIENM